MLIDLLLYALTFLSGIFVAFLPSSSFWPLPSGLTDGLTWLGQRVADLAAVLPDGTLTNLTAALTLVAAVNLFVIPWLAARGFRLPFAAAAAKD